MAYLSIQNLVKQYNGNRIVDQIQFEVEKGSFLSLLGPSGCGKTTTLRMIAGFEKPDQGEIYLDGKKINDIPVHKRNIGMVFQSYALFPHMTVEENIAYGLQQRKIPKAQIKEEVAQVIEMVRLKGFEKRKPKQLSGGQQQRVALARALVIKPSLLLLDESLSALDKRLRVEMQVELREIQRRVGITTIFVTHDQEEAMTLSDQMIVMKDGKIMQMGRPESIYERPANTFVASFLGESNFIQGRLLEQNGDTALFALNGDAKVRVYHADRLVQNQPYTLSIRPEKIRVSHTEENGLNHLRGKVNFITYVGNITIYRIEALGQEFKVQIQNDSTGQRFAIGDEVNLSWDEKNMLVLAE